MTGACRTAANPAPASARARPSVLAAFIVLLIVRLSVPVSAQTVEFAPLAGYRFGGDLFEIAANRPVDLDGAPVVGGAVNVDMGDGLWFEALFSHQQTHVSVPGDPFSPPARLSVVVDHWLAGGRQEFGTGRARPFLTGLLGLTRYGAEGDHEVRFTVGAGGGVKLPLQRWIGLRLDSRVFTTFVDGDAHAVACTPGICLVGLSVNVAWQIEFTADVVVVF
jgi:hypothetical protein